MSRIGENRLHIERNGEPRPRVSAPIRKAIEVAERQSKHSLRRRLEVSCQMSTRDAAALPYHTDQLYAYVVERMMDVWDDDESDLEAARLMRFLRTLQDEDEPLLVELFGLLAMCCSGAVMEGWIAGVIYASEKAQAITHARNGRPGR